MRVPACVNLGRLLPAACVQWLIRILLILAGLFMLAFAAVYVFLQRDPDALIDTYLRPLEEKTGLEFRIGALDVTLLPLPALSFRNIVISGQDLVFTAAQVTARPGLLRILTGDFTPAFVSVQRPRLTMHTDQPLTESGKWFDLPAGSGQTPWPDLALAVSNLEAQISGPESSSLLLANGNADLNLTAAGSIGGNLDFAALRLFYNEKKLRAGIENFHLAGHASLNDFLASPAQLKLVCALRAPGILAKSGLRAEIENSSGGWSANYGLEGDLDVEGYSAPMKLSGSAMQIAGSSEILLRDIAWQLEHDSGTLDLACYLPPDSSRFELKGSFRANRLSLTQWMGWARNLPPGLQLALDNVTDASLKFTLNRSGLAATDIEATCAGSTFTGTGGVADWSKPEVTLTMSTDSAVLAKGVPEALGRTPDPPRFPHPPLTPLPDEPLKPGEQGIGYKISLSAQTLHYGYVKFQNASLLAHPGKLDKTGFRDCLLDGKASFYGGRASGACILGADPSLPYHITARAEDINTGLLAKDLSLLPLRAGRFNANAVVTSRGKKLAAFLAALKGDLAASGENVRLDGSDIAMQKLDASLRLRSGAWDGAKLTMDGIWRASAQARDLNASCQLDGKMAFGSGGSGFRNLPGELKLSQKGGLAGVLKGVFSAAPESGKFEAAKATLAAAGESAQGEIKVDASRKPPVWQGNLKTEIKSLNAFLARLGFREASLPANLNSLKLTTNFSGTPDVIRLANIDAKTGQSSVTGSLGWNMQKKHLDVDLTASQINLSGSEDKKGRGSDWNYPFLTKLSADGKLASRDLVVWDLRFVNAVLPFHLEKGKLAISKAGANFCGGPVTVHANADFNAGLNFDASFSVRDFNLTQAGRDRKLETRLTGSGSAQARLEAKLSGNMKLLNAISAQWAFTIKNGSWQSAEKGELKGKPTSFNVVKASGSLRNGYLRSDNFTMAGEKLDVSGGGWLNLANRELNCDLAVDFNGLPEFPLRLYGSLQDPRTSIGTGRLALNAIGGLASGFANAIGGLFRGVWGLFSR